MSTSGFDWSEDPGFRENHVVTINPDALKTIGLENSDKLLVGYRAKLWHVSAKREASLAEH